MNDNHEQYHSVMKALKQIREMVEGLNRVAAIFANAPLRYRIKWRIMNTIDTIRRLLQQLWAGAGVMMDSDNYEGPIHPHRH